MKENEEGYKQTGFMCCGPWMRRSSGACRFTMGLLMMLIGVIWFSARMEWLDLTWLHSIPLFPLFMIIIGFLIVHGAMKDKKGTNSENRKEV